MTVQQYILVIRDAAVDDSFLAGIDDDVRQLYGGVRTGFADLPLIFPIPINQVLECYLLQIESARNCSSGSLKK